ncbi:nitrilase-related carbon-nitrogen hydrolase [Natranaerobius thermophilus]|uniref:Nitrilase/cyanide hydratase and apolipoprotein N-acyltransferase n=1 Tax=Natranaerobius thermophilus (strain ATCC BAA-1301 / DSM 18059 / JW/NM-WN-LF) TaxID=457570 RepID=B2A4K8_NATTJ|nr:nitrilase-related carbon-nitrogen hydrolase [Natranaerobius thermophilus]ACB85183.1 Nitrilase/cyanide hydratase and apolipoprotein N-acyltransferase [Natranaerobius thermophilus JW/NM-WN-LF]
MFQVAAIQMTPIMNDVDGNIKRGVHLAKNAIAEEADLIVFPELWTTGYHLSRESFRALAEKPDGKTVSTFQEIAKQGEVSIVCPFVEEAGDKIYIAAAVIDTEGETRGIVRKSLLWGREQQIFNAGVMEYPTFDSKVGKIGILICYEMEFPETSRLLALEGAEVIVCPSVWSMSAAHRWEIQLPARALDNTVFVLGVNTVGNNSCGKSKLLSPMGDVLAEASGRKEEILIRAIDKEALLWARDEVSYLEDYKTKLTPGGEEIPTPIW